METNQNRRCCGIDVHQKTVVVCVLPSDGTPGEPVKKVYGTFRNELTRMRGWLKQLRVTDIAMESTGVYWRPVWNVLEGHFAHLLLANPKQVKALQGRKSDHRDARRIAEFLQDGRLDASFVPPPEIRRLRDLTRCRVTLLGQRDEIHNKIRDLFETANVKLSSVMCNLLGVSGQRIIQAMVEGQESAEVLSWKLNGKLRPKEKQVRESLKGCFDEFHRMLLAVYWQQYRFLNSQIEAVEAQIALAMEEYAGLVELLDAIPGVDQIVAWTVIAEMGIDMTVFPDAAHCASWVKLCPGTHESAGKQMNSSTGHGNRYLRRVLLQAAWAASHSKNTYLRALFYRIKARRGWGKAIVAVAHKLVIIIYQMLRDRVAYLELGADHFDRINPVRTARKLVARLERLGLQVTLQPLQDDSQPQQT